MSVNKRRDCPRHAAGLEPEALSTGNTACERPAHSRRSASSWPRFTGMYAPQTPVRLGGLCLSIKLFLLPRLQGQSRRREKAGSVRGALAGPFQGPLGAEVHVFSAAHSSFREKRRPPVSGFCTPFPLGGSCPLFCTSRYLKSPGGDVTGMCSASLLAAWKGFGRFAVRGLPFRNLGASPPFRFVVGSGGSHRLQTAT